jgi:ribose 5-phosphate isomerase B
MIAIANDHVGLTLKKAILDHLTEKNLSYEDLGCNIADRVDYPVYALKVAEGVADGRYEKGILICGTGVGISIAANKVAGIRAIVCSEPYSAMISRKHNNTNILALGSRVVGSELAKMIVDIWLNTQYEAGRHQKRIDMIANIEKNTFKAKA